MRKLKRQERTHYPDEMQHNADVAGKTNALFIALFLVVIVIFLVTMLSLTHGLMDYRTNGQSGYVDFFVNYHITLMVILVAAATIFGAAIYCSFKENRPQD